MWDSPFASKAIEIEHRPGSFEMSWVLVMYSHYFPITITEKEPGAIGP